MLLEGLFFSLCCVCLLLFVILCLFWSDLVFRGHRFYRGGDNSVLVFYIGFVCDIACVIRGYKCCVFVIFMYVFFREAYFLRLSIYCFGVFFVVCVWRYVHMCVLSEAGRPRPVEGSCDGILSLLGVFWASVFMFRCYICYICFLVFSVFRCFFAYFMYLLCVGFGMLMSFC